MCQLQAQKSSEARWVNPSTSDATANIRTSCIGWSVETMTLKGQTRKADILLSSYPGTSPKILALKSPYNRRLCVFFLSLSLTPPPFPLSLLSRRTPLFSLLRSKGPFLFASVTYFLSPRSSAGSLLLPLWLSKETFVCIWVLALNFVLAGTQVLNQVLNQGSVASDILGLLHS